MSLDQPSAEQALRQLAQINEELRRAAAAGDLSAVQELLAQREAVSENLRRAVEAAPLDAGQCDQIGRIVREGDAAARDLIACRETVRSLLAELETERLKLAGFTPQRPGPPPRLDLDA